ncbi:MAG: hypothetical protein QM790_20320 [Nibricoccus sp.]
MSDDLNSDLRELEAELRNLRPRSPSAFAEERVRVSLAGQRSDRLGRLWRGLSLIGVAAAVAVVGAFSPGRSADRALQPTAVKNQIESAKNEGIVTLSDGTPALRYRLNLVETVKWSGPDRSIILAAPREEVRLVPLVAY